MNDEPLPKCPYCSFTARRYGIMMNHIYAKHCDREASESLGNKAETTGRASIIDASQPGNSDGNPKPEKPFEEQLSESGLGEQEKAELRLLHSIKPKAARKKKRVI